MAAATVGRRVVTEPLQAARRTTEPLEETKATDLYTHDNAKITKFTVLDTPERPSTPRGREETGKISWQKPGEIVLYGRLRLYQTPSESLMLGHGNGKWDLAMMQRTKCWCVDNESIFAIKVRQTVYRIELPSQSETDKAKVEEFKRALDEHILYEKDPCPFKRGFEVETITEEAGSPTATMRLRGTRRDLAKQLRPVKSVKSYPLNDPRSARRSSIAATESSPDVSDEDAGSHTPPKDSERLSPLKQRSSFLNGNHSPDDTKPSIRPRQEHESPTRSFTAPVVMAPVDLESPPSSSSSSKKVSDEVQPHPVSSLEEEPGLKNDVAPSSTSSDADHARPGKVADAIPEAPPASSPIPEDDVAQAPQLSPPTALAEEPISPLETPTTESISRTLADYAPPLPPVSSSPPASSLTPPAQSTPSSPTPLSSTPQPQTPIRTRQPSASTTSSARLPGTPPFQPALKSSATTSLSLSSPRLRHSSLTSEDDIPTLGIFSQTLNVLLGPPSGLLAVLVGVARRVGSFSRSASAGTRGLGLGRQAGDGGDFGRRAGMPGSWDSEDEGASSEAVSSVDADVPKSSGPGLKKRHSWASASDRATGRKDSTPTVQSGLRPEVTNEWTDDDLD